MPAVRGGGDLAGRAGTLTLTDEQRERYARNLLIPGVGEVGQARLAAAQVAIVGLGGLGSPAALYLAAAGVGALTLVDPDVVERSNLQRQVLHGTPDLGRPKVDSARETLAALNPDLRLTTLAERITAQNAGDLAAGHDVVVEATDNFEAKFLINDSALEQARPFATAGILALSGQAQFVVPGRTPCLRCTMEEPPSGVPTTAEQGVLGAVPGILGSLQAMEVIRYLAGVWTGRSDGTGYLHSVDGATMRLRSLRIERRNGCRCAPLWDER